MLNSFIAEAKAIKNNKRNKWLTYGLPLHRMRGRDSSYCSSIHPSMSWYACLTYLLVYFLFHCIYIVVWLPNIGESSNRLYMSCHLLSCYARLSMCAIVCVCASICDCVNVYVHTLTDWHISIHIHVCVYTYVYICVCVSQCVFLHMHKSNLPRSPPLQRSRSCSNALYIQSIETSLSFFLSYILLIFLTIYFLLLFNFLPFYRIWYNCKGLGMGPRFWIKPETTHHILRISVSH